MGTPELFPPVGLYTDTTQTLGVRQLEARSHLVSKAPTGEPLTLVQEREQLLQRVRALELRCTRLEDYLRDHTLRGRWRRAMLTLNRWIGAIRARLFS
jgi:hypothetical protein